MRGTHTRAVELPFRWPSPPLRVALVHPQIPPNTGNISRLCAATGSELHLVQPLGFRITDADVRRAGLDYWDSVRLTVHDDLPAFERACLGGRYHLFSTGGTRSLYDTDFQPGDTLVFGSETEGLPQDLLDRHPDRIVGIPILTAHVRSLNLSTSAGIALYEALRQIDRRA